jgi:hypothetical protein
MLWVRGPGHRTTGQDLLREAIAEWRRSGEPDRGPNPQIFEQQAAQGYYDDAMATARLFTRIDDQDRSIVELAKIRAENGDIQGAKTMIKKFVGSDLGNRATKIIAEVQADKGDLRAALETSSSLGDSDEIFVVFARRQIANGDFDGALRTAEQVKPRLADDLFYKVGDALRVRGEQERMCERASHMSNRRLAALFAELRASHRSPLR